MRTGSRLSPRCWPTPLMTNTRQPSTGLVSSVLGPVRYLSDGDEQVLLQPRKDTASVYDAAAAVGRRPECVA